MPLQNQWLINVALLHLQYLIQATFRTEEFKCVRVCVGGGIPIEIIGRHSLGAWIFCQFTWTSTSWNLVSSIRYWCFRIQTISEIWNLILWDTWPIMWKLNFNSRNSFPGTTPSILGQFYYYTSLSPVLYKGWYIKKSVITSMFITVHIVKT